MLSTETAATFNVLARVSGGGVNGQADAVKLGIARALMLFNVELRKKLKAEGMVSRDSRSQRTQEVRTEGREKALPVQQAISRCGLEQIEIPRSAQNDKVWLYG